MSPWETAFCAFGALVGLLFTGVPVGFAMMIVGAGGLALVIGAMPALACSRRSRCRTR